MATLLYRLGKTAFRRWPLFLVVWLVAMAGVGTFAATMSRPMTDAFSIPGIPSEKAADLQAELFPDAVDAFDQATVNVVVAAPEGHALTEPTYVAAVDDLIADLADLPQMPATAAGQPGPSRGRAAHPDGRAGGRGRHAARTGRGERRRPSPPSRGTAGSA